MSFYNYYVQYKFFLQYEPTISNSYICGSFLFTKQLIKKKFCNQGTVEFTDVGRHF